MAIKLCKRGHITGYRVCGSCGTSNVTPVTGPSGTGDRWNRKQKRAITARLRAEGILTVADIRQQHFHPSVIGARS